MASGSLVSPHVSGIVLDGSDGRGLSGEPDAYLLDLLVRMRNVYVLELRRRAFDRLPEPTRLLLEVDEALGIANHQDYDYLDLRAPLSPVVAPPSAAGLT